MTTIADFSVMHSRICPLWVIFLFSRIVEDCVTGPGGVAVLIARRIPAHVIGFLASIIIEEKDRLFVLSDSGCVGINHQPVGIAQVTDRHPRHHGRGSGSRWETPVVGDVSGQVPRQNPSKEKT